MLHLRDTADKLGLKNLEVIQTKAENLTTVAEWKAKAQIVSTRAVGKIPEDGKRAHPYLCEGGFFVTYKHEENHPLIDGYHPLTYVPYQLPMVEHPRTLVIAKTSLIKARK